MNVNATAKHATPPHKRLDLARIREPKWWLVLALAIGTIVVGAFVRSGTECKFLYQAELAHYLAQPGTYGREPVLASTPVPTVLIRIGGQVAQAIATWIAWTTGLYLIGLLIGQREARLGTLFKVVSWSWLPFVVRGVAQSIYMSLAHDPIYNPGLSGLIWDNTPPPPGGGYHYVMPTQSQLVWAALLGQIDIYLFWHLALLVGGLRGSGYTPRKAVVTTLIVALALGALSLVPTVFGTTFRQFRLF